MRDPIKNAAACTRFLYRDLQPPDGRTIQGGGTMMVESITHHDNGEFELRYFNGPASVGGAAPNRKSIRVPRENVSGYTYAEKKDFEDQKFTKCHEAKCLRWSPPSSAAECAFCGAKPVVTEKAAEKAPA